MPMTDQWRAEFLRPRGPNNLPAVGTPAPDFELPYARFFINEQGEEQVEYGHTMRLSDLRGEPVVLNFTRIVSDRFF